MFSAALTTCMGKPQDALRLLEKAMRLNPYDYEFLHHLGVAHALTGRLEEAIPAFKCVLIRNPDFPETHLVLAIIYIALGREEEARAQAAEVLRINPNFSLETLRQTVPMIDQEGVEPFRDALRKAGLR